MLSNLLRKVRTAASLVASENGMARLKFAVGENLRNVRLALAGSQPCIYRHANGCRFVALPSVSETRELYLRGQRYEKSESTLIRKWLRHGDFFLDCGANVGLLSALAADCVGPSGMVWSVEPSPSTRKKLEAVLRALELTQIIVVPKAIADGPGEVAFEDDSTSSVANAISRDAEQRRTASTCKVATTSMDALLASAAPRRPAMVKLDIEGAEPLAFRGWQSLATTSAPPLLMFEVYPRGLDRMGFLPTDIFLALPVRRYRFWHLNASWPNAWPQFPRGVPFVLDDPFTHQWPMHSNVLAVPTEGEFASRIFGFSGHVPGI